MFLDRIPFIERYRGRQKTAVVRRYVAELGAAGSVALLWLVAALAVFEMTIPGFAANYLSPGWLVAAFVVTGGLALLGPAERRTWGQAVLYAAGGVLAAVCAFLAAWYYFSSVPDVRTWLSLAAGLAVASMFTLFSKEI